VILPDLVKGIAGQLGNTWRTAVKAGQPVIVGRLGWLIFGPSPDSPALMRVTLLDHAAADYGFEPAWTDMPFGCGIGDTSVRIHQKLLVPARALRSEHAARQTWCNEWCMRLTAWGLQANMNAQLDMASHKGLLLSVRAEFYCGDRGSPRQPRSNWGAITVFYDNHPLLIEYFTDEQTVRDRLDGIAEKAEPTRRGIFRRKTA